MNKLKCLRCDEQWIPRIDKPPVQCPRCKSPFWNIARKNARKKAKQN